MHSRRGHGLTDWWWTARATQSCSRGAPRSTSKQTRNGSTPSGRSKRASSRSRKRWIVSTRLTMCVPWVSTPSFRTRAFPGTAASHRGLFAPACCSALLSSLRRKALCVWSSCAQDVADSVSHHAPFSLPYSTLACLPCLAIDGVLLYCCTGFSRSCAVM